MLKADGFLVCLSTRMANWQTTTNPLARLTGKQVITNRGPMSAPREPDTEAAAMAPIWRQRPDVGTLQRVSRGTAISTLGIEFTEVGDDFLAARMPVDARTIQPLGRLHGGALVLLAETLGSAAAHCCVEPTQEVVGIEINANHVRSARDGWVHGVARPVHLGRSTQLWDIRIEDDAGRLVCVSRLTMSVLGGPASG